MNSLSRFESEFTFISKFLNFKLILTLIATLSIFLFTSLFSHSLIHHFLASLIITLYLPLSFIIERKHINYLFLTPLTIIAFYNFLTAALGVSLWVLSLYEFDNWLFNVQLSAIVSFPLIATVYYFINYSTPSFKPPIFNIKTSNLKGTLEIISWILILFITASFTVGILTGSGDRGVAGEIIERQKYGIWTLFIAFGRFIYLGFVLVPFLWRYSPLHRRLLVVLFLIFYFLIALTSGARGYIIYPGILIICGIWIFGKGSSILKKGIISLLVVSLFLIPFINAYRISTSFNNSKASNLVERFFILAEGFKYFSKVNASTESPIYTTGKSLVGCSDYLVYRDTPKIIPHAGWQRIDAVLYIFQPTVLNPNKPSLLDTGEVSALYTGGKISSRHSDCITFNGDLYRRFGWSGIIIGNLLFGIFYSSIFKLLFILYNNNSSKINSIYFLLLILFTCGFIAGMPNGTLLSTIWIWLWELPKYIFSLFILYGIVSMFVQKYKGAKLSDS